jgi:hypothetical protein
MKTLLNLIHDFCLLLIQTKHFLSNFCLILGICEKFQIQEVVQAKEKYELKIRSFFRKNSLYIFLFFQIILNKIIYN